LKAPTSVNAIFCRAEKAASQQRQVTRLCTRQEKEKEDEVITLGVEWKGAESWAFSGLTVLGYPLFRPGDARESCAAQMGLMERIGNRWAHFVSGLHILILFPRKRYIGIIVFFTLRTPVRQ
jgi:hypothetical protein